MMTKDFIIYLFILARQRIFHFISDAIDNLLFSLTFSDLLRLTNLKILFCHCYLSYVTITKLI